MSSSAPLSLHAAVRAALEDGRPIVALESSVISHGLPWPENLELARDMEAVVRAGGAEPATIAVLEGRLHIGLAPDEIEHLARTSGVWKVSRRDFAAAFAQRRDGATTVAATLLAAHWAGIRVMATGGIGAPRRPHRRLRRPAGAGPHARPRRLRRRQGDPRSGGDAGVAGNVGSARRGVPH